MQTTRTIQVTGASLYNVMSPLYQTEDTLEAALSDPPSVQIEQNASVIVDLQEFGLTGNDALWQGISSIYPSKHRGLRR